MDLDTFFESGACDFYWNELNLPEPIEMDISSVSGALKPRLLTWGEILFTETQYVRQLGIIIVVRNIIFNYN